MKTIEKERIVKCFYTAYVADDGKEFTDSEECKKYEESAFAAINAMYQSVVIGRIDECSLTNVGCDDNFVDVIKVADNSQAAIVLRMYFAINTRDADGYKSGKESSVKSVNSLKKALAQAIEDNDFVFIGRAYNDECFWLIGTRKSMTEQIDECIMSAQKKKD